MVPALVIPAQEVVKLNESGKLSVYVLFTAQAEVEPGVELFGHKPPGTVVAGI